MLVLLALLGVWIVIYPGTDYYLRWVSPRMLRKGNANLKQVHLSFDDGPDPQYTPRLLQILAEYRVTASFFLVGRRVELHPKLARRILAEGHEIGSHTYGHLHAYGLGWGKSKAAIAKNATLLCEVLGQPVTWFRPPWGAMNLFEWITVRKAALRPLLWTANAGDWLLRSTPELIRERLVKRAKPGAILLLHDSGGDPGAPERTLQALPEIIERLRAAGYQFVSLQKIAGGVDSMSGLKGLRGIGDLIDRRYLKKAGASTIPGSRLDLLMVCYHPYHGKVPLQLEPTTIAPGERIGEFHLSNIRITQIAEEDSKRPLEWRLMELLKSEFGALAEACVSGGIPEDVQAFYGVNVLVAGAKRLGFSLVPIPKGWNRWWLGFWESLLRLIYYSFETKKKASLKRTMDPYEIWITREELVRRYLPANQGRENRA